jgi:hypothetical protein
MDGRYEIFASHGKGVFSVVVRARDVRRRDEMGNHPEVAIKLIRANEVGLSLSLSGTTLLHLVEGLNEIFSWSSPLLSNLTLHATTLLRCLVPVRLAPPWGKECSTSGTMSACVTALNGYIYICGRQGLDGT